LRGCIFADLVFLIIFPLFPAKVERRKACVRQIEFLLNFLRVNKACEISNLPLHLVCVRAFFFPGSRLSLYIKQKIQPVYSFHFRVGEIDVEFTFYTKNPRLFCRRGKAGIFSRQLLLVSLKI
jgi:hypothetical protein